MRKTEGNLDEKHVSTPSRSVSWFKKSIDIDADHYVTGRRRTDSSLFAFSWRTLQNFLKRSKEWQVAIGQSEINSTCFQLNWLVVKYRIH